MTRFASNELESSRVRRRGSFLADAEQELERVRSGESPATVLAIQVNGLLGVRLALGEHEASEMASEAVGALVDAFGEHAIVGRLGAAEFAVFIADESDAGRMRSRATRAAKHRGEMPEREWRLVLRAGATTCDPHSEETLDIILERAREDLRYRALGLPGVSRRPRVGRARAGRRIQASAGRGGPAATRGSATRRSIRGADRAREANVLGVADD